MSLANPLWGAPRIHGELLKLGIAMGRRAWLSTWPGGGDHPRRAGGHFCRTMRTASPQWTYSWCLRFRSASCMVCSSCDMTGAGFCGSGPHTSDRGMDRWQLTEACGWDEAPRYLVRDRDRSYGEVFVQRVRAMGIRDQPTSPRSPWQNGYAERLIGSIRRECIDHVIVFDARHLCRLLRSYLDYYNGRAHTYPWTRIRRSRAPSRPLVAYSAVLSSVDYITDMSGFNFRQAQRGDFPHNGRKVTTFQVDRHHEPKGSVAKS